MIIAHNEALHTKRSHADVKIERMLHRPVAIGARLHMDGRAAVPIAMHTCHMPECAIEVRGILLTQMRPVAINIFKRNALRNKRHIITEDDRAATKVDHAGRHGRW